MKKRYIIILTIILTLLPQCIADAENSIIINEYDINIKTQNDKLLIEEKISLIGQIDKPYNDIYIWINESAEDLKIKIFNDEIGTKPIGINFYTINISSFNISQESEINLNVKYSLNKNINEFRKINFYKTDKFILEFDYVTIFNGYNLSAYSNIILPLYKPTEAPISSYLFIAIFLIVLLVLISTYYVFRRQKTSKIKNISGESKELLSTKKLLIMSLLKQLEKEYRAKKISDDTYNKLRSYYKQEAVESMKKLEDIESEII